MNLQVIDGVIVNIQADNQTLRIGERYIFHMDREAAYHGTFVGIKQQRDDNLVLYLETSIGEVGIMARHIANIQII